ncbi:unnamed protein product [Linum trigynum]|uniref:Uncharacterized protein n=1 Tax=Linum trigynum TaxID=586398 RepID=A0AAV2FCY0_9ROSI
MERLTVTSLTLILMIVGQGVVGDVSGEKEKDRITDLPGLPAGTRLEFQQYAGYVTLFGGNQVFYYLVEYDGSSASPAEETWLIMWFSGGRVCSSVGSGGMLYAGPLRVQLDGSLKLNPWALNKVGNAGRRASPNCLGSELLWKYMIVGCNICSNIYLPKTIL